MMASSMNIDDDPIVQALLQHPIPEPTPQQKDLEKEWHGRASDLAPKNLKVIEPKLVELDKHLTLRSHIVGYTLSRCDLVVWGVLRSNHVASSFIKRGLLVNLNRWFNFIEESNPWIAEVIQNAHAQKLAARPKEMGEKGGDDVPDIELPDVQGQVVTRFPPEPSGFLHIGHAKAALLNDYFAHKKYKGKLILRFDDTNPLKEKQEFEDSIIEDLALMGVTPDQTTHTSDYFQELYEWCVQMLKEGTAYADDTDRETLAKERFDGIASKRRDASPEENLAHFEEMKQGTEEGKRWYIRAKISVDDPNKAMRDPVIYRCQAQPHHRTGDRWKIYPTYDFCCPLIDVLEGVTHALRTTEYNDRDAQYQWFIKALNLRKVHNWNFSRLSMVRTLLSKRKLTKFVNEGVVWGWDDPRMATVRGVRRRGCTVPALQEFIIRQGPSRNITLQDWSTFWTINKKHIDAVAARYTALKKKDIVTAKIMGFAHASPYSEDKDKHAKHPLGKKKVWYSDEILIEQDDAQSFEQDEEITLMNWGNAIVRKVSTSLLDSAAQAIGLKEPPTDVAGASAAAQGKRVTALELDLNLQGDVKKTSKKITWLSSLGQELIPCELVDFDYLITKDKLEEDDKVEDFLTKPTEFRTSCIADCNVAELNENDVLQFDRRGYFRVDRPFLHGEPAVFFQIPSGRQETKK